MDVFDRADGVTVIDDSYNANPASMSAALRALAAMGQGRRAVAVLGYMAELGAAERSGHEEVGRLAAELRVDRLYVVGEAAAPIHDGASADATWKGNSVLVTDQASAVDALRRELRPGDVVLVKGSRYRTWEVVDALRAEAVDAKEGSVSARSELASPAVANEEENA
jgi:UDP-N-acetylmuramoyl-tripeptide--D-alanyl-D-alanine ligase